MTFRTAGIFALVSVGLSLNPVYAQSSPSANAGKTEVAVSAVALASIQPVDRAYVGEPYLDKGLGGVGPGVAVGVNVTHRRFAATGEFSTAAVAVSQAGRLVGGQARGRLRDSMFTVLAGVARSSPMSRVLLMAGASRVVGVPTLDNVPIDQFDDDAAAALGFTGGIDVSRLVGTRAGFLGFFRYSYLPRGEQETQISVGRHVFRAGVGIRLRLTD